MLAIRHEPAARRFVIEVEGATAFISYRELPDTLSTWITHSFRVPFRGGGIASQLTAHALRYARDHGYSVAAELPVRRRVYRAPPGVSRASRHEVLFGRQFADGTYLLLLSIGRHPEFETGVASMPHGGRLQ